MVAGLEAWSVAPPPAVACLPKGFGVRQPSGPLMIQQAIFHETSTVSSTYVDNFSISNASRLVIADGHMQLAFAQITRWTDFHEFSFSPAGERFLSRHILLAVRQETSGG